MKRMLADNFRTNMRTRRQELAMTQKDLADVLGCTAVTVSIIERGPKSPTIDTIERIAHALRCPPINLLSNPTIPEPPKKKRIAS
jgi:transcriptional regulator with XRE-family HTH domain